MTDIRATRRRPFLHSYINLTTMSGVEATTVLGTISATLHLIEASRNVFHAAKDAKGLHEAFRKVSENIPLVEAILEMAADAQQRNVTELRDTGNLVRKEALETSAKAIEPVIATCKGNVDRLKLIFDQAVPSDQSTRMQRYLKALQTVGPQKKCLVEELMGEILAKLQLLRDYRFLEDGKIWEKLADARHEMSQIPRSLQEESIRYSHTGSGPMNIGCDSGQQRFYTQSGGFGKMYFGDTKNCTHSD